MTFHNTVLGIFLVLFMLACANYTHASRLERRAECVVPANEDGSDDTPAILEAFHTCRSHGRIVFQNTTYHINQIMKTVGLVETDIHIYGTLLVCKIPSIACRS